MHGPHWSEHAGVTGEAKERKDERLMGLFPDGTRLVNIKDQIEIGDAYIRSRYAHLDPESLEYGKTIDV